MLDIVTWPDDRLLRPCRQVETQEFQGELGTELIRFVGQMVDTMTGMDAVGLAANQVGDDRQILIMKTDPSNLKSLPMCMINPKVIKKGGVQRSREGCLSFPGETVIRARYAFVTVMARDMLGTTFTRNLRGYPAVVFQHEHDHLLGKVFREV